MSFWDKELIESNEMWYDDAKKVIQKEDKVVVKLRKDDDTFIKSIIIPTEYYPLNDKYQVFTWKNTQEVTDKKILAIFDKATYEVGHCYKNSSLLLEKLKEAGYDAKSYCGWLFVGQNEIPIHHCWLMIGNSIIDLSDELTMYTLNYGRNIKTYKESRESWIAFHRDCINRKNSERCCPVGVPSPNVLYVGCECSPEQGRLLYQNMMKRFPNHECEANCNAKGENITQLAIKEVRKGK